MSLSINCCDITNKKKKKDLLTVGQIVFSCYMLWNCKVFFMQERELNADMSTKSQFSVIACGLGYKVMV